jgi:hypothetical protein
MEQTIIDRINAATVNKIRHEWRSGRFPKIGQILTVDVILKADYPTSAMRWPIGSHHIEEAERQVQADPEVA